MSSGNMNNWKKGYNAYRGGADNLVDNQLYSGGWSGETYGTLIIDSYQDGRDSEISFDYENAGVYDTYEDAKNGVMAEGAGEIVVGSIGIVLSIAGEISSGGVITTLAYAGFIQSADLTAGGVEKVFNPEDYMSGNKEAKPIKALIGQYIGEEGEAVYEVIDFATGVKSMTNGDSKLEKIVGAYQTVTAAEEALEKQYSE